MNGLTKDLIVEEPNRSSYFRGFQKEPDKKMKKLLWIESRSDYSDTRSDPEADGSGETDPAGDNSMSKSQSQARKDKDDDMSQEDARNFGHQLRQQLADLDNLETICQTLLSASGSKKNQTVQKQATKEMEKEEKRPKS